MSIIQRLQNDFADERRMIRRVGRNNAMKQWTLSLAVVLGLAAGTTAMTVASFIA